MRLFFAVPLSPSVREVVTGAVRSFPVTDPPWRWIAPSNYHLTLKFLGEVDERLVPPLHDAARRAASSVDPFRLSYGWFGGFPKLSRPLNLLLTHPVGKIPPPGSGLRVKRQNNEPFL